MLKMYANGIKDGKPIRLIVLGLSHMNLTKLFEGKPIMFSGDTCGLPADVEIMIFAGETEQVMQQEFAKFIGPDTAVHIDPKLK